MANTHNIFEPVRMASQDVVSLDRSVVCASDLDNGDIVIETTPATNVFSRNEMDVYTATAPADAANDVVCVVDSGEVARIEGFRLNVADPRYNYVPAGVVAKARQLVVGDEFRVTATKFASAPTVGQYVGTANGLTTWTASNATITNITSRCVCKVISSYTFPVGLTAVSGYVLKVVKA